MKKIICMGINGVFCGFCILWWCDFFVVGVLNMKCVVSFGYL